MPDYYNTDVLAQELVTKLIDKGLTISTAESCTGGLLAKHITDISGASQCFDRGFITYSNKAKEDHLSVKNETLENLGAVSEQTAIEMALGCKNISNSNISLTTTGIAGPSGGTLEKPVGLVYIGYANTNTNFAQKFLFKGNRDEIRNQATYQALKLALKNL